MVGYENAYVDEAHLLTTGRLVQRARRNALHARESLHTGAQLVELVLDLLNQ